ncbi:FAD binding domain-containing protein [Nocardioides sp.]|uniref:FAD binding domain-containing protein n=1 Tax=Nocardioides sp. TaxID=35761 RepID=UPI0039E3AAB6
MKPAAFRYHRPTTPAEAWEALAADPGAKVLAGGQSLVPLLSMRLAAPSALVDINGIRGLDAIEITDEGVRVGALVRHADLLASPAAREAQPLLALALSHVAHATIRNRGTCVGSIAHADPSAELPAVLALLGGSLTAGSARGTRVIPAADLFIGPLETTLDHDELALAVTFPALPAGAGVAYDEIARRHGDYAMAGVAALVAPDGTVTASYVSCSEVPTVVDLTGVPDDELGAVALRHLDPVEDIHATADYRAHLVEVLTRRVVSEARKARA